jgi:sugar phosphate permease
LLSFPGFFHFTTPIYFYFNMFCIGAVNSAMFPTMVSIMGNWFPKKNRGFLVGLWSTCSNAGNTIGIQLAALLLSILHDKWWWLFVIVSALVFLFGVLIFIYLVPHPKDIGISVEEMTENELLLAAATNEENFQQLIDSSVHTSQEVVQKVRQSREYQRMSR